MRVWCSSKTSKMDFHNFPRIKKYQEGMESTRSWLETRDISHATRKLPPGWKADVPSLSASGGYSHSWLFAAKRLTTFIFYQCLPDLVGQFDQRSSKSIHESWRPPLAGEPLGSSKPQNHPKSVSAAVMLHVELRKAVGVVLLQLPGSGHFAVHSQCANQGSPQMITNSMQQFNTHFNSHTVRGYHPWHLSTIFKFETATLDPLALCNLPKHIKTLTRCGMHLT